MEDALELVLWKSNYTSKESGREATILVSANQLLRLISVIPAVISIPSIPYNDAESKKLSVQKILINNLGKEMAGMPETLP